MFYELWDVRSGNIINTYDTDDEALRVVRDLLRATDNRRYLRRREVGRVAQR